MFDILLKKLHKFGYTIDIEINKMDCYPSVEAWCLLKDKKIDWYQNKNVSVTECCIVLAHELGHIISEFQGQNFEYFQDEKEAWITARKILKSIGFKNWKYFYRIRKVALRSYMP